MRSSLRRVATSIDLDLRPFLASQLPLVQPWFEHPEVRLRLGGPEWPVRGLRLQESTVAGEEFRGNHVLRAHSWLAWRAGVPVGYLGGDVYDRWSRYDGSDPDQPVVDRIEAGPAMSSAYLVHPACWRQGVGAEMLRSWVALPEVSDVRVFALGIDDDNVASRRCAEAAGFRPASLEPDWEGTVHHLLRRG